MSIVLVLWILVQNAKSQNNW